MSKLFITTTLGALLSASLAAQATQTPTPPPSASPSTTRAAAANSIVVQGCIQPSVNAVSATPNAVGTSGSVSTATPYILTSAEKATGTSGASAASPVASTYQLSVEDSKLIPHVGHVVEITGTVVSPDKSSSTAATSAGGLAPSPTLKVESVKMIADRCPN